MGEQPVERKLVRAAGEKLNFRPCSVLIPRRRLDPAPYFHHLFPRVQRGPGAPFVFAVEKKPAGEVRRFYGAAVD